MEDLEFSIKALAALKNMSIKELAESCNIPSQHLMDISAGRVKMQIEDLRKLSEYTGIPSDNIVC